MHHKLKVILISILLSHFSYADELFIDKNNLKLASTTLSEKYCKDIKKDKTLCKSKKLSYLDFDDKDLPSFMHDLKIHMNPILQAYKSENLKKSTLNDIKDLGEELSGNWYHEEYIDLFSKTTATYTLSNMSTGYSGGAHGYHAISFRNFSIKTQKELKLNELFVSDSNKTLHTIAQKYYKMLHNLKANQSLVDNGWFEDKFILAENFSITPRGLLFHYNSYEIKPYAEGHTRFLLPYSKIKKIINPTGTLKFALQKSNTFHTTFHEEEIATIILNAVRNKDTTISITVSMKNEAYANKVWLSLSFPQLQNKNKIIKMQTTGFDSLIAYPKDSKVYHRRLKKSIPSQYLLIEAEDEKWDNYKTQTITLALQVPQNKQALILNVRATLKSENKTLTLPHEYDGITGQQGYKNYKIFIEI